MSSYIIRRFGYMLLLLWLVSLVAFFIIQLPEGDYVSVLARKLAMKDEEVTAGLVEGLRLRYGLDQPVHVQYLKWFGSLLKGDFGHSFYTNRPVSDVIGERLALTVLISMSSLAFTYIVSIPVGIYSATHQYKFGDYIFMTVGFIGLAIPNFLLALVLMFVALEIKLNVGGLFSPEYQRAGWSLGKVIDLLAHLPLPVVIVGTAGTAGLIRIMRGQVLDELEKQYVITARAKGVREGTLLFKYPVRVAINPIISTIGWLLPEIVSGSTITALVLGLPTIGPLLFISLMNQDMYLASSIVLILSALTVIGTFISDMLLALSDPRIRFASR